MSTAPLLAVRGLSIGMTPPNFPGPASVPPRLMDQEAPQQYGLAVKDVSFTVQRGETLCLVGESGCGKSISALAVMRLLPEGVARVLGGSIHFAGQDLLALSPAEMLAIRGNAIGMVFQDPAASLNPVMRIGRQIAEGIRLHKRLSAQDADNLAIEMLEKVRIPSPAQRAREYPHQMSGGMRQRVMIAMALACAPDLLVADEPTTALDVTVQKQILQLIHSLVSDSGSGLLLISHDLGVVAGMADRIAVMYAGSIVEMGPAEAVLQSPLHPYTVGLVKSRQSLLAPAKSSGRQLEAIPGTVPGLWARPHGCAFHPRCSRAVERCREHVPEALPADTAAGLHSASCWLAG